jgi:hypothetical protein
VWDTWLTKVDFYCCRRGLVLSPPPATYVEDWLELWVVRSNRARVKGGDCLKRKFPWCFVHQSST